MSGRYRQRNDDHLIIPIAVPLCQVALQVFQIPTAPNVREKVDMITPPWKC